jgi:hypothetical protein
MHQLIRHAVQVVVHFDVVIDVHATASTRRARSACGAGA